MHKNLLILLISVVFLACKGESVKDKELSMVAQIHHRPGQAP